MSKDIFRAECDKDFDLPPCPYCGRRVYIQQLGNEFRVNHFCRKTGNQLRTKYCKTPQEAVDLYLSGEYEYRDEEYWKSRKPH